MLLQEPTQDSGTNIQLPWELACKMCDTIYFATPKESLGNLLRSRSSADFLTDYFTDDRFSRLYVSLGGIPIRAVWEEDYVILSIGWEDEPDAPYVSSSVPAALAKALTSPWRY